MVEKASAKEGLVRDERVDIQMRDGTLLAASVTRPSGKSPFPTVVCRTPYDRAKTPQPAVDERWACAGYAFLRQDVRGRFDSAGEFYPFRDDPNDGYDTIEWIAQQDWSDGKVGLWGFSHIGIVQYLTAPTRPPHLTAAIPLVAPVSVYHRWWYQGGAFRLGFNLAWVILLAQDNLRHFPKRMAQLMEDQEQVWETAEQMLNLDIKPLFRAWSFDDYQSISGVFGNNWFKDFMEHPDYGPFWHAYDFNRQHAEMETPMLHIGGWYDTFCQGTIDSYVGLKQNAKTKVAREAQRLIMGPWFHVSLGQREVGELDFGEALLEVDPFETQKRWFDHWLRNIDNGVNGEPPIQIFVMGENVWRSEEEWPLSRQQLTPYYMHSDGAMNREPPGDEHPLTFTYDPADPVITLGGCEWVNYPRGPFDQKPLDGRQDILRFLTEPLMQDIEVTGQIFAHVWASSTARDTDITAKLIDVYPDGKAYNICDGILRGRYRETVERQVLMEPNESYEFVIDMWSTSNLFPRGHRIRVDISSSNFPRFDANPNTGDMALGGPARTKKADNTIYFDRERSTHIVLPIIPR
jgi:uncharacterized protein